MSLLMPWLGVMFPLVFSPGPANIVFAACGAQLGVRRSLPFLVGVDTVFLVQSLVVGFGLAQVVARYPYLVPLLQLAGAAYLVYLATGFLRSGSSAQPDARPALGFVEGVTIQTLNGKGWLLVVLMFSLFGEAARSQFGAAGTLVLVAWLAVLNVAMHLVWIKAGALLARLGSGQRFARNQNRLYGTCLLLVAVWLIVDNDLWPLSL
ncbi:LysE family translocator [Marinobacter sp. CA1]|uniref:LysE family translocator n=1 Tax=Marinobacter sp. CA1 TaxID=2817656 RepID=UPI001D08D0A6|nr:LysE family translocator [Marinobacter sp. CA1]UDL04692.1 LysE family translocator [Marinobacter sp. CA1]